jgi:hypothetical protein
MRLPTINTAIKKANGGKTALHPKSGQNGLTRVEINRWGKVKDIINCMKKRTRRKQVRWTNQHAIIAETSIWQRPISIERSF